MSGWKNKLPRLIIRLLFFLFLPAAPLTLAQSGSEEMLGKYRIIYDSTFISSNPGDEFPYRRYFFSRVALADKGREVLSSPATPVIDVADEIEITAFTRLLSGEIIFADSSNIVQLQLPSGRRRYFINYSHPQPGSELYLEWTLKSPNPPLSGQRFLGRTVPVDSVTVVISAPRSWIFNFAVFPDSADMPGLFNENSTRINATATLMGENNLINYSWTAKNIPGIIKEVLSPPPEKNIPTLFYSLSYDNLWPDPDSMKITWRYIARIYSEKLHEFQKADNFLIPPADSINSLRLRPIDAFLEAYRWFHSNFKITSSELTLQQRPSDLWRSRTGGLGECSALFYSLLAKLRIPSQPYLCSSRLHGEPLPNIPALFWFDKFLLMVPFGRDTIWTDLESPQLPLDIVPFGNQGILGLNIGDEPGAFVRTPQIDYRDNGKAIHMDISLDTMGNFDCDVTEIYSHAMIVEALDLLTEFSRADLQFAWEKEVLKEVPGAKLRNFVIIPRDSTTDVFRIAYQFSAAGIYRPQADRIYIPADFFGNWAGLPLMTENIRYSPMEIDRPRFELERISIKIPANYKVAFLPESNTYDSFLGEYFTAFRAVNDAITVTRAFGFKRANMPSTAYDAMKKFLYKIHAEADKQIILRRIN